MDIKKSNFLEDLFKPSSFSLKTINLNAGNCRYASALQQQQKNYWSKSEQSTCTCKNTNLSLKNTEWMIYNVLSLYYLYLFPSQAAVSLLGYLWNSLFFSLRLYWSLCCCVLSRKWKLRQCFSSMLSLVESDTMYNLCKCYVTKLCKTYVNQSPLLKPDPVLFLCQDYFFCIENAMFSLVKLNLLKSYVVFKGRNKGRNDIVST